MKAAGPVGMLWRNEAVGTVQNFGTVHFSRTGLVGAGGIEPCEAGQAIDVFDGEVVANHRSRKCRRSDDDGDDA